jgi:hypothetical protein
VSHMDDGRREMVGRLRSYFCPLKTPAVGPLAPCCSIRIGFPTIRFCQSRNTTEPEESGKVSRIGPVPEIIGQSGDGDEVKT